MASTKATVGFTYDLREDYLAEGFTPDQVLEFDKKETIDLIAEAIVGNGYRVEKIGNIKNLTAKLVKGERWDLVFNICEGASGRSREAQVPALLEAYGIPYVFSDPLTAAATLDKTFAKKIVREAGLTTPAFYEVFDISDAGKIKLPFPLFVKPNAEGTSKGIDKSSEVNTKKDLHKICKKLLVKYQEPVLVETYLPGREFTVGILGTGGSARVLGTMEAVSLKNGNFQTSSAKENCEKDIKYLRLTERRVKRKVENLAFSVYKLLEVRDAGRVDIRLDKSEKPYFLEVNPLPGLHPTHSDLPMIAAFEGISYRKLIGEIIVSARKRI